MYSFLEMRYFVFKKVCFWVKLVSCNSSTMDVDDSIRYTRLVNDILI
jgi:hypothetical protein